MIFFNLFTENKRDKDECCQTIFFKIIALITVYSCYSGLA